MASEADGVPRTVAAWFEQQAARRPQQLAIRTVEGAVTYAELDQASDDVAAALLDSASPQAAPVALLLGPGGPSLTAWLGALKAGLCYVPLDPGNPPVRNRHIIADAGARLVLTDRVYRSVAEELVDGRAAIADIEQLPRGGKTRRPRAHIGPDAHACILYTSGSTGKPKGVLHSQGNVLHYVRNVINGLRLSPEDRLCHLYSSGVIGASRDTLAAVCSGATACPYSAQQSGLDGLAEWLLAQEVTVWQSVTTVLRHFLWTLRGDELLPRLRVLRVGGNPLTRQDVALARRHVSSACAIVVYMGMTEVSPVSQYIIDGRSPVLWDLAPAGYPVEGMEVLLLDPARHPVPTGEVGEIAVRSGFLSLGYWRRPELTSAKFVPPTRPGDAGMYLTGDLGRLSPDGCLEHLGRADSQVKIRGFRVEVAEVEDALRRVQGVAQAAVVAVNETGRGTRLVAYLVPGSGGLPGVSVLRRTLRRDLPDYMVPSRFVPIDALPLTASGKVDARALSPPEQGRLEGDVEFVAPRDLLELQLGKAWEDVLGVQPVGVRDDFFELGGDSLLAVNLFARIEAVLGRQLPLATLLRSSTIERLAEALRDHGWVEPWSSLVAVQTRGSRPPFFCVHGVGGNVIGYWALAKALGPDQPFYGLQAQGLSDGRPPLTRIEAMAAHYVEEMRVLQPEGPYYLGGISFGGLVAYEMAQQLHAREEQVGLLALFDSSVPRPSDRLTQRLRAHWTHLEQLGPNERLRYLQQRARTLWRIVRSWTWRARHGRQINIGRPLPGGPESVREANYVARSEYAPQPYAGRVTLFRALTRSRVGVRDQLSWQRLAKGGVEVRDVPGDHVTLIEEPHVRVLATSLNACLERAQAGRLALRDVELDPAIRDRAEANLDRNATARGRAMGTMRTAGSDAARDAIRADLAKARAALKEVQTTISAAEPKTERSRRAIALPTLVVQALKAHQKRRLEMRLAAGRHWQEHGLVFTSRIGTPTDGRNLHTEYKRILREAGLANVRFHDLRHTAATLLLAQGVGPRTIMETLGHSQISLTLSTYSHVLPSLQEEAARKMDAVLTGTE